MVVSSVVHIRSYYEFQAFSSASVCQLVTPPHSLLCEVILMTDLLTQTVNTAMEKKN
jgi:hypothetical protein